MKKQFKWIWYAIWLLICLVGGGCTLFSWMPRTPAMFYGGYAMLVVAVAIGQWLMALAKGKNKSYLWGLMGLVAGAAIIGIVTLLCDHVLFPGKHVYASLAVTLLSVNYFIYVLICLPKQADPVWHILKRAVALVLVAVSLILGGFTQNFWWSVEIAEIAISSWKPTTGTFENFTQQNKVAFDEGEFVMGEHDLIVAPDGNDTNPGTLEAPLQTLEAAKEKVTDGATVWFRAGTYLIAEEVSFGENDAKNVTYRSMPGEEVIFTASVTIDQWENGTINGVSALVAQVDTENWYFHSLYKDGQSLQVSCWPKEGTFQVKDALSGDKSDPGHSEWGIHGAFYAELDEVMEFANQEDVYIRLSHKWIDEILPIANVDTTTGRIELSRGCRRNIEVGDVFVYENVRETLSEPGQWYLDRSEGKLYYIPKAGETAENTVLSAPVNEHFLAFDGASNIRFQGINFENSDWSLKESQDVGFAEDHPLYSNLKYEPTVYQANQGGEAVITVSNSQGIDFVDCRLQNIAYIGIRFGENVRDCTVDACHFNYIGASAVVIDGKNEIPSTTGDISVTNCLVSYYGRVFNQAVGIHLTYGDHCTIANNEIHDGYYTGISAGWEWSYTEQATHSTKILNNLIYNIAVDGLLSDLGGIYLLGPQPDSVLSGNVIYNVDCADDGYGATGIYLDAGASGWVVENNLVSDCATQCFTTAFGRNNIVRNNIFAFGNRFGFYVGVASDVSEECQLEFCNNIVVVQNAPIMEETIPMEWFEEHDNLLWDYSRKTVYSGLSTLLWQRVGLAKMHQVGHFEDALIVDPGFANALDRDLALKQDAAALQIGFAAWNTLAGTPYNFD